MKPATVNNAINNALLNGAPRLCYVMLKKNRVHKWLIDISFTTSLGYPHKEQLKSRGGVIQFVVHWLWFRSLVIILFGQ